MNALKRFKAGMIFGVLSLLVGAWVVVLTNREEATTEDAGARSSLRVAILDAATGERTPVRVKMSTLDGRPTALPEQAIGVMYGMWDHADGYGYQPDSAFYVDGFFELDVEPGRYVLAISKGNEFEAVRDTIHISGEAEREYRMERWIDTAALGWYSADDHIHVRRSPRENPLLLAWTQAEDVRVGNLLRMGDFWEKYYSQYAFGSDGVYHDGGYMLVSGQEDPRTPELGHVIGLGASTFVRFPNRYYLYDLVFDSLRAAGGVGGYAHQAESFHGHRGLTLDGLRGKVDVLEVVQFCVPGGPLITDHFYDLLNLGFPVTVTAGSDFPWCGKPHDGSGGIPVHRNAQIGNARFYAYVEGELTYDSWMAAVRAGRTFATSGPILFLEVNGRKPGSHLELAAGERLTVEATAFGHSSQTPLSSMEVVVYGEVVGRAVADGAGQSSRRLSATWDVTVEKGMWIAARAAAGSLQVAHTTPIYVTVDGGGFHDDAALDGLLHQSDVYLSDLEHVLNHRHENVEHQAWRYREALMERIDATRGVIERMRRRE